MSALRQISRGIVPTEEGWGWMARRHRLASLTAKVMSVVRVSLPLVLGVFGIRAQWPASARKCLSRSDYPFRRNAFLDPVHHRAEHVELV